MKTGCPDCHAPLRGDGSCCDRCEWALAGGGDDPRLPSQRSAAEIKLAILRRELAEGRFSLKEEPCLPA